MGSHVPGMELARQYYDTIVGPILADTPHTAARVGWGSDVLGYDTERSTDHGWGPHLHVFVAAEHVVAVRARLDTQVPALFAGWPTRFGWDAVAPKLWIETSTLDAWLLAHCGCNPRPSPSPRDWLLLPQQTLLEMTAGAVFHDDDGTFSELRAQLRWYPDDVWLYLLACAWQRIAQEEAFVGRTHEVGDELGSRVVIARLARDVMRLCFLIERRYAPYSKWFGTAFTRLEAAPEVAPLLRAACGAPDHHEREAALALAYEAVARRHNALGRTEAVEPTVRDFHSRPFRVLDAGRLATACRAAITDDWLQTLPLLGSVDQVGDSTDLFESPAARHRLGALYD